MGPRNTGQRVPSSDRAQATSPKAFSCVDQCTARTCRECQRWPCQCAYKRSAISLVLPEVVKWRIVHHQTPVMEFNAKNDATARILKNVHSTRDVTLDIVNGLRFTAKQLKLTSSRFLRASTRSGLIGLVLMYEG
jgi:hypothetical protein